MHNMGDGKGNEIEDIDESKDLPCSAQARRAQLSMCGISLVLPEKMHDICQ